MGQSKKKRPGLSAGAFCLDQMKLADQVRGFKFSGS